MSVSEATYRRIALEDPSGRWELHCGRLRSKPSMTAEHNQTISRLCRHLYRQVDETAFDIRASFGTIRRSPQSYSIPDVYVVPVEQARAQIGTGQLEVFTDPLPLVVEVWSPSAGDYDVEGKLPEYQPGDLEIWRIHPHDRTLMAWPRQQDGSYAESTYEHSMVRPVALPGVTIDLDALFA